MSYATNASTPAADLSYDVGSNGIRSMEYPKKSTVSGMEIKQEFLQLRKPSQGLGHLIYSPYFQPVSQLEKLRIKKRDAALVPYKEEFSPNRLANLLQTPLEK